MNFDELRKRCESEIERHLLRALYPELGPEKRYGGKRGNGRINRNSYGHGGTYFPLEDHSQQDWSRL